MKLICKKCNTLIPSDNVNVAEGICYCRQCNEAFRIASYLAETDTVERAEKPDDTLIESYADAGSMGMIIPPGKSKSVAFFFLFFSLFWNGITWTIFIASLSKGEILPMLFMIPFILVGILTFFAFLFYLCGEFSLMIDLQKCYAIWSVSKFKYKKTVRCNEITDVAEDVVYTKNHQPMYGVGIKYGKNKSLRFASSATEAERLWIIGEIRHFLKQNSFIQ